MRNKLIFISLLVLILSLISCGDDSAGGGSGGHMLTGTFIDESKKPVEGALVYVYTEDSLVADSTYTDFNGDFQFKTLVAGLYDIKSIYTNSEDTLSAFIADIYYDSLLDVGTHIMKKPGKIAGVVQLYSSDHEGVDCYIPGTSYFAKSDSAGQFTISGIPPADEYVLSLSMNGYSRTSIQKVPVKSDSITLLDTITLELDTLLSPPKVEDVKGVYDTVTGLATLTWSQMPLADLKGYIIYGQSSRDDQLVVLDTVYKDKESYEDSLWLKVFAFTDRNYRYQMKALDTENNLSVSYSNAIEVLPEKGPSVLKEVFVTGALLGECANVDSVVVSISDSSSFLINNNSVWQSPKKRFSSLLQIPKTTDSMNCEVKVFDSNRVIGYRLLSNIESTDTLNIPPFNALNAQPIVTINPLTDTVAYYGDSLTINFSVTDSFYTSLSYYFKGGDDLTYTECDSGNYTVTIPNIADNSYPLSIKAIDDAGNIALDSISVPINVGTTVFGSEKIEEFRVVEKVNSETLVMARYAIAASGSKSVTISRTDNNGAPIWSKDLSRGLHCEFKSIAVYNSYIFLTGEIDSDLWIMKLDTTGAILWEKTFGGSGYDRGFSISASTKGLLLTGHYGTSPDNIDIWVLRISHDGKLLWEKMYGGTETDKGRSIVEDTVTNTIYVAGETASIGSGGIDVWLLALNKNGDTLWTKTFGGSENEDANTLTKTSDNHLLISGRTNSFGAGGLDIYVIKTTLDGDTLWTKTFGTIGNDFGTEVIESGDKNYIITGGKRSLENLSQKAWLAKISPTGDILWEHVHGNNGRNALAMSVCETGDNGLIMVGGSSIEGGVSNFLIIKADHEGKTP